MVDVMEDGGNGPSVYLGNGQMDFDGDGGVDLTVVMAVATAQSGTGLEEATGSRGGVAVAACIQGCQPQCSLGGILCGALDLVEAASYGVYFVSYETAGVLDDAAPGIMAVAPVSLTLIGLQFLGLGGDVAIDLLQGEGVRDEGHRDSILPDPIQSVFGFNPDERDGCRDCMPPIIDELPGIHRSGQVDLTCGILERLGVCR